MLVRAREATFLASTPPHPDPAPALSARPRAPIPAAAPLEAARRRFGPQRPTAVDVDEATRILRATHAFGVLGDAVIRTPPTDTRVHRLYEEALVRLQGLCKDRARPLPALFPT